MKLYNLLQAKVGHISDNLFHEALYEAQRDIRANRSHYDKQEDKLGYVIYVMETYIRMVCKFDLLKEDRNE
jgi:hypothetical protein